MLLDGRTCCITGVVVEALLYRVLTLVCRSDVVALDKPRVSGSQDSTHEELRGALQGAAAA